MSDLKSKVAEVKLSYDIVDYIQQSGIKLRRTGNKYTGLCCFHNEKSPSFSVDQHFQNYRCFGCNANGDIINFVEKFEHLEFFEALKKLAEDKNIKLDIKEEKSGVDYSSLREAMRAVSNFYYKEFMKLPNEHPAKREILERGLTMGKMLYGYAPETRNALYDHMVSLGFQDETILLTGACLKSEKSGNIFDFWSGRLMFFITDITGKAIGWSGRKLYETDKRGKYVNSKDGILFDKGNSLYNVFHAKKKANEEKIVYVAEGQFDVAALVESGLTNSVASSGTAFTEKQGSIVRRLVGESGKIVFCFDGDAAGLAAAEKVFKNAPILHTQAFVVSLPEGMDPCDFRLKNGNEELAEYITANMVPLLEFVLSNIENDYSLDNDLEKTKFIEAAARALKTVSNTTLRDIYIKRTALNAFVSIDEVKNAVNDAKPLSSESSSSIEPEPVESKRFEDLDVEKTAAEIKELIINSEHHLIMAKILYIALKYPVFFRDVKTYLDLVPKEFETIVNEGIEISDQKIVIPENFSNSELIQIIIDSKLAPFINAMKKEHISSQYKYLKNRLNEIHEEDNATAVKRKIFKVLKDSPAASIELLEKAIEREKSSLL